MAHPTARTARARSTPSRPALALVGAGLPRGRVLDYGSGRGLDAEWYGWEAFDPHHGPELPRGKFDTVVCTYVLNVLPPGQRAGVIRSARRLLRRGGRAYFSVRRDLGGEDLPPFRGMRQYHVELDLPVALERAGAFCTYVAGPVH